MLEALHYCRGSVDGLSEPRESSSGANEPMRCPICRKKVQPDDPFAPFCSDRCRIIDLGNWASEKYLISTPVDPRDLPEIPEEDDDRE